MIDILLNKYQEKIETKLNMLLVESDEDYKAVIEASRYSLLDGGKRIRPIILLEFYKLCGGKDDGAYNFACALEMIHTYSLIHDDLPCMDDDDYRRGKLSCHKRYGETMAVLAGDALLTKAFAVAASTSGIEPVRVVSAISYLADCAGINGMIGGQVMDIDNAVAIEQDVNYTLKMYSLKTSALIKAAAVCGAILAGADEERQQAASLYAEKLGLAFQVVDDILDKQGDEAVLGKPVGSDDKNSKITLVSRLGIEKCTKLADSLTNESLNSLDVFDGDKSNITELTKYLLSRQK